MDGCQIASNLQWPRRVIQWTSQRKEKRENLIIDCAIWKVKEKKKERVSGFPKKVPLSHKNISIFLCCIQLSGFFWQIGRFYGTKGHIWDTDVQSKICKIVFSDQKKQKKNKKSCVNWNVKNGVTSQVVITHFHSGGVKNWKTENCVCHKGNWKWFLVDKRFDSLLIISKNVHVHVRFKL